MGRHDWYHKLIDMQEIEDVIHAMRVTDECGKCGYFNPNATQHYRCRVPGRCIAATLHHDVIKSIQYELGWSIGGNHA